MACELALSGHTGASQVARAEAKHAALQDGQALVRHGETGVRFFVIRYGLVSVMRPLPDGGRQEVAVMRRGQFVGERTLITGEPQPGCVLHDGQGGCCCAGKAAWAGLGQVQQVQALFGFLVRLQRKAECGAAEIGRCVPCSS